MQHIVFLIQQYGLLIVFLNVLLDLGGAPLPSYPTLATAGALTLAGGPSMPAILIAALMGALIADLIWYSAGRYVGRSILAFLCRVSLSPDYCVRQTESIFTRIGPSALLFAKFIPGVGSITVGMSGVSGLSLPWFLLLDGLGAIFYVTFPVVLGRVFHNAVDAILTRLARFGEYGLLIVIGALVLYLLVRWIQRQAFIQQLRMDRISASELAEMIDDGNSPVILDVRSNETRLREGVIPGALTAPLSDVLEALKSYPRDREVVVYCSCPNEASAATAAKQLKRAGFKKIRPLLGGIEAWTKAGRPVAVLR
jgi:membrane protein DedA with SNARE-associated domain/rhodanese-related sulfurtransferase